MKEGFTEGSKGKGKRCLLNGVKEKEGRVY